MLDSHANAFARESTINNSMNRGPESLTAPSKPPKLSEYTSCRRGVEAAGYDVITFGNVRSVRSGEMNSMVENGF